MILHLTGWAKPVFENVLGQNACNQLTLDIKAGQLAPAMLFSGPAFSGKGTAALELGRIVSCEAGAAWDCGCSACSRHRSLLHQDMLCLGSRLFSAEIAASAEALIGKRTGRIVFIRSVRKLLLRFNPVLWENESRGSKIAPLVNSVEEDLNEFEQSSGDQTTLEKLVTGIAKNSYKLEAEGISDYISIGQIRRAAWWSRLAPAGNGKLLIIENAERMQEESRNSLLKILEEPPDRLRLTLTTSRQGNMIPTILSRLRVYKFYKRDAAAENEVIRRVFRDTVAEPGISIGSYLDSFIPVSGETIENLAAFFAASAADRAEQLSKKHGRRMPKEAELLGKFCAPKAESAGLGEPQPNGAILVNIILDKAEKFEIRSLFSRFLNSILDHVSGSMRQIEPHFLPSPAYNEMWRKNIAWAESAAGVYNLRPAQVMEKLFFDLSTGLSTGKTHDFTQGMAG